MKHRKWFTAGVVLLSAFTLAACSNDNKNEGSSTRANLPSKLNYDQKGTAEGNKSTLKVAEVNDSPFAGIASSVLQTNTEDSHVYSPGGGNALFNNDDQFKVVDGGLANLRLDKKTKTATIILRNNAKWSNGMKVTAKDVEYPYEMIANKDSQSQQYSADMNAIEGLKDYHDGKAKTISGITFPKGEKGNVVKIKFNKFSPALKTNGNSFIWSSVEPYEYYKGLPITKISESDQVRKNPIFTGPYKLKKQVTGESTSWVPNKYYWGQTPKIKNVTIQVISSSNFSAALKSKKYDFTFSGISSQYDNVKKLKDY